MSVVTSNLAPPLTLLRAEALASGKAVKSVLQDYVKGELEKLSIDKVRICKAADSLIPTLKVSNNFSNFLGGCMFSGRGGEPLGLCSL